MDNNNHPLGFGLVPIFDNIPGDLRSGRWCVWKAKAKGRDKYDKIPFDCFGPLKTSEPDSWLSFDEAVELYKSGGYNGIGRLCERDGLTVIDIDRADTLPREVKALGETYCERSPSGKGLRLVYRTDTIPDRDIKEPFEVYSGNSARFLTFTGHIFKQTAISSKNGAIKQLIETVSQQQQQTQPGDDNDPFQGLIKPDFNSDDIKRFLSAIDPDAGHDIWFRVMQGLHHHYDGGDEGKAILDNWSRLSKDYDRREIEHRWASLGTGDGPQVTAASIKRMALDAMAKVERESDSAGESSGNKSDKDAGLFLPVTNEFQAADHTVRWTIEGFVEHQSVANFYGRSEIGKSFLAIQFGLCVATGMEWNGKRVRKGKTLYMAGEGHKGINRRVYGWRSEHGFPDCSDFIVTSRAINLGVADDRKKLVAWLDLNLDVNLVVVDTFGRATAGLNENLAEDVQPVIEFLAWVTRKYDCTVMVVHHTPKHTDGDSAGSKNIKASMDVEMCLTTAEGVEGVVLECRKMKEARKFAPMVFDFISVPLPSNFDDEFGQETDTAFLQLSAGKTESMKDIKKYPKLGKNGRILMKALECVFNERQDKLQTVPDDVLKRHGAFEVESIGVHKAIVKHEFERMTDAKNPRDAWSNGLNNAIEARKIVLLDDIICRFANSSQT